MSLPASGAEPALRATSRAAWRELALILAVSLPVLFAGLGVSFLDPDEGLYADIAREMLRRGDPVLPRFNGLPYLEKPPLYFWLGALLLWMGVPGEWALRGWSALAALASVLLAWRIGRRLYGREAGVLAALALATTAGYALYVRKASTDFLFVGCLAFAVWGFLRDADRPDRRGGRFLFMYLAAGLGLLAKGLIGLVLPAVILGASLLWVRGIGLRDLNLGRGLSLLGLVVLPWHLAAAWRDPALFWFYLADNQVLRFLGRRGFVEDDVSVTTLGFLLLTFVWLFPWSVFLLARPATAGDAVRWRPVVVVWAVVVLAFFALSRSKLEYYALPASPAVALLVGGAWASGRDIGRWLGVGLAGCALVGAWALWVGSRLTADQALWGLAELNVYYRILREQGQPFPFASAEPFGRLVQGLGAALILGWAAAALCWARGRRRGAFGAVLATGAAIAGLIIALVHLVEPHHSTKAVAGAIRAAARPADVIVHEGSLEYSAALPFYTERRIVVVNGARGDLDFASRLPEGRGMFLDDEGFRRLWAGEQRVFLVTQRPPDRSVVRTVNPAPVHPLGRFGSRWLYSNRPGAP